MDYFTYLQKSFCTNEFLAETQVELIMKISGHKSLKDFYNYIKIAPEQAGERIKEISKRRLNLDKDLLLWESSTLLV